MSPQPSSHQVIELLAKGLENSVTLRQLEVNKCQFAHELQQDHEGSIQILIAFMNHHSSLINMKAVGVAWTPSSVSQALSALIKCQQLKHLDLSCCKGNPKRTF